MATDSAMEFGKDSCASVTIPKFWHDKVALWFMQVEAQFQVARITKDDTKFAHVVANLDAKYIEEVEDIVCNPAAERKYEVLKTELIKRLSDSRTVCVRRLLEKEEVGDRTPTQFWRHLKKLAGKEVSEEFLVELYKSRLPEKTQLVLAATSDTKGETLAEIAERVHDISGPHGYVAAIPAETRVIEQLCAEMKEMRLQMNAIMRESRQPQRTRRSSSRARSKSRSPVRDRTKRLCWYHFRHAEKATRCVTPCAWNQPKTPEN
nr:uncharacterized protein LOC116425191 [Nomia melanderi]